MSMAAGEDRGGVGLGEQLLGLAQVCAGLEVIDDAELQAALQGVEPGGWYPVSRLLLVSEAVKNRFPYYTPILFRAAEMLITKWVEQNGMVSGLDFLELQRDSTGYHEIIRGSAEEVGEFVLIALDPARGIAQVRSTTPFDAEYERGVLYSGTMSPGDMSYVHVEVDVVSARNKTFTITFRRYRSPEIRRQLLDVVQGASPGVPPVIGGELAEEMLWAFRSLREQYDREREYFVATNANLKTVMRELTQQAERLRGEALTDPLTKAFNRRHAMRVLDGEVNRSRRDRVPLSLIALDIDLFKRINDRYGHAAGDQVLVGLVQRVQECLRSSDVCARIGGEEFLIILPATHAEEAQVVAEKLCTAIAARPFQAGPSVSVTVTVSLGVAELEDKGSSDTLLMAADAALYSAKRSGRNRVEMR